MISAELKNLYTGEEANHILEGEEYWYAFGSSEGPMQDICENDKIKYRVKYPKRAKSLVTWVKLKITYKRAGVIFYRLPDFPNANEDYFLEGSLMLLSLIPCKINVNELMEWRKDKGYGDIDFNEFKWYDYDGSIEIENI